MKALINAIEAEIQKLRAEHDAHIELLGQGFTEDVKRVWSRQLVTLGKLITQLEGIKPLVMAEQERIKTELDRHTIEASTRFGYVMRADVDRILWGEKP